MKYVALEPEKTVEILFVDDSDAHVRVLRESLAARQISFRLQVASNGKEALDRLFRQPPYEVAPRPDLILLELDLPLISGLDVLDRVKTHPQLRSIPAIVFTRAPRAEDLVECYRRGASSVIARPIPLEELEATFGRVVLYWTKTAVLPAKDA